jgi:hypothetical protein
MRNRVKKKISLVCCLFIMLGASLGCSETDAPSKLTQAELSQPVCEKLSEAYAAISISFTVNGAKNGECLSSGNKIVSIIN